MNICAGIAIPSHYFTEIPSQIPVQPSVMPRLQAVVHVLRPCKPCRLNVLFFLGVCRRILTILGVMEVEKYVPIACWEKYICRQLAADRAEMVRLSCARLVKSAILPQNCPQVVELLLVNEALEIP